MALFVHQEARRIGIAGELYKSCASWFVDQGVERVEATALPGDIAMKAFFESYGYKAISLTMGSVQPFSQGAD
ncbi:MAG: GNAT family N-acetyltransferase [Acidimicrobiales bacterium]|nr:GNAT family N-acetyltransferase [Acidimicrobiales bacterium]